MRSQKPLNKAAKRCLEVEISRFVSLFPCLSSNYTNIHTTSKELLDFSPQLLDHSVQKIVDRGFTIEQAEYALRVNRNNVDKALKSLQRTDSKHKYLFYLSCIFSPHLITVKLQSLFSCSAKESREPREPRGKRFEKKTEESKPSSGKISLFDFLEDKLPVQPESIDTTGSFSNSYAQNSESNQDRLESRNTDAQTGRGARYVSVSRDKLTVLHTVFFNVNFYLTGAKEEAGDISLLRDTRRTIETTNGRPTVLPRLRIHSIMSAATRSKTNRRDFNVIRNLSISINITEAEKRINGLLSQTTIETHSLSRAQIA